MKHYSRHRYENMTNYLGVQEGVSRQEEFNASRKELWQKWREAQTWEARGTSLPVKQIELYNEVKLMDHE